MVRARGVIPCMACRPSCANSNVIMNYRECGVPSLEPVFFGMRGRGNDQQAILVTEELAGFIPLDGCVRRWSENGAPSRALRLACSMSLPR